MKTERVPIALKGGLIDLKWGNIHLTGGHVRVKILDGEEKPKSLTPRFVDKFTERTQNTPVGLVTIREYAWKSKCGLNVKWRVGTFEICSGICLEMIFENRSQERIHLDEMILLASPENGVSITGNPSEWWLSGYNDKQAGNLGEDLPSSNDLEKMKWGQEGKPVPYPLSQNERANDGHWRIFRDFVGLFRDKGREGVAMAAVGDQADVNFDWRVNGSCCQLEIISAMSGVMVEPGESRSSERVVILGGSYDETVNTLNQWIAQCLGARTHRRPPVGWCSWYEYGAGVTGEDIVHTAQAIKKLRERLPLEVIQVDDGYQKQVGIWDCNNRFPEGWSPIVDSIRDAKATAGIWIAPLVIHKSVSDPANNEGETHSAQSDWFQKRWNGELTDSINNWGHTSYWLDPTHPDAERFLREQLRGIKKEGFKYVKIDFNTLHENVRWHDTRKTRLQVFRDLYCLYREELGEGIHLLACTGQVTRGVVGYADSCRIGPDSNPVWEAADVCCMHECFRAIGRTSAVNGVFFVNDPDVVYSKPRERLPSPELRTWLSLVGLLGGSTLTSEPLHKKEYQTEESLRLLEILLPPSRAKGRSLWPGADPEQKRFGFIAERAWGYFGVVLVHNPENHEADISLDSPDLRCLGPLVHAWSFWDESYLGVIRTNHVFKHIQAHHSILLRLTPVSDEPLLIGSNLHITLGAEDIASVRTTGKNLEVHLTSAGATNGNIYLFSMRKIRILNWTGCQKVKLSATSKHIWKIHLKNRSKIEHQKITIKHF